MFKHLFSVLSPVSLFLNSALSGAKKIGTDPLGNVYFQAKARKGYRHTRRWVIYKGAPDASAVPPEWHGWLHHQTDLFPDVDASRYRKPWQKAPKANLTGTPGAWRPPGSLLAEGRRPKATGDYEAWTPSD